MLVADTQLRPEIVAWVNEQARPLSPTAVAEAVRGATVVGLGETSHGTREFFRTRFDVLRVLVTEHGFTAVAIEGSFGAAELIDAYVAGGPGDPSSVLRELSSVMWCVEEFAEVLEWLRAYNGTVTEDRRVRFWGLDPKGTRVGRERVLAHLRAVALDAEVESAERLFAEIAEAEALGPLKARDRVTPELELRMLRLSRRLTGAPDDVLRHAGVLAQWVDSNASQDPPAAPVFTEPQVHPRPAATFLARSAYLAENLTGHLDHAAPGTRVAVWAHTFHLGVGFREPASGEALPNLGHHLRRRFGDRYYSLAFELHRGRYLGQRWTADVTPGELAIADVPASPPGSIPGYLARGGGDALFDLRRAPRPPVVASWLGSPQLAHSLGWYHSDPPLYYARTVLGEDYDGVVMIDETSPTTPLKGL